MKSSRLVLVFLGLFFLVGCEEDVQSEELVQIQKALPTVGALKASRVVAYRFSSPEDGGQPVEPGFSLVSREGVLNRAALELLKKKEVTLTTDQVGKLVDVVYGPNELESGAACYDPHHIFLFYGEAGRLLNTVEGCFSCVNIGCFPELPESQWRHHDFRRLARLCDEVGIGMTSGTAEDFIRMLDERDEI